MATSAARDYDLEQEINYTTETNRQAESLRDKFYDHSEIAAMQNRAMVAQQNAEVQRHDLSVASGDYETADQSYKIADYLDNESTRQGTMSQELQAKGAAAERSVETERAQIETIRQNAMSMTKEAQETRQSPDPSLQMQPAHSMNLAA